ncbi:MAG TPA: hypothetical protein VHN38_07420 [Immundisolibacter sp.]|nr:hypothetical protein [Immundisolibacter sp.]
MAFLRQAEQALGDDDVLDLVGAAGDAHARVLQQRRWPHQPQTEVCRLL